MFAIKAKVNASKLNAAFKTFDAAEKASILAKVVRKDAMGFVKDVVSITPPSQGAANTESKKRGEDKVKADVRKAYGTANEMWLLIKQQRDRDAADAFWAYVKTRKWKQANDIARNITGKELVGFDNGAEHKRRRNRKTGRVVGGEAAHKKTVFIKPTQMPKLWKYARSQQRRVGLLASGFVPAAEELGVKLLSWIVRHKSRPGFIKPKKSRSGYAITISNTARYAQSADLKRHMQKALNYTKRQKRIANAIKYEMAAALKKRIPK